MRATSIIRSARAHKPMIQFLGKRQWPTTPHEPAPHPAAPRDLQESFQDFLRKYKASVNGRSSSSQTQAQSSTGKKSSDAAVYDNLWELPKRYRSRSHMISQAEMEAVESGGASVY